jgi:hypothetical protein
MHWCMMELNDVWTCGYEDSCKTGKCQLEVGSFAESEPDWKGKEESVDGQLTM